MDDNANWGLTQFWELLTMILCVPKDFKHEKRRYLITFGSKIKYKVFLKAEEAKLWILAFYIKRQES